MYYYTVDKIGSGTSDDPIRPNIPDGTPFVGNVGNDGNYLITSTVDLGADTEKRVKQLPTQALQNACNAKGIPFNDVYNAWKLGGS
jgi:hypothetical protein